MLKIIWAVWLTAMGAPVLIPTAFAQLAQGETATLQKDVNELKEGQKALQRELQEIKTLLQQGRPQRSPIEDKEAILQIGNAPSKGSKNAPLTLVEFSDYQCPFCARHTSETLPQLDKEYIQTGKLRYVFRDFPIESIHKDAFKAAEATRCAGDQGRYWELHDRIFANQRTLSQNELTQHANVIGIDPALFSTCMESGKYAEAVRKDMEEGRNLGIAGTPTFFIGRTDPAGMSTTTIKIMRGAQAYSVFKATLDSLAKSIEDPAAGKASSP